MFLRLLPRPRNERTLPRSGDSPAQAQQGAPILLVDVTTGVLPCVGVTKRTSAVEAMGSLS